MQSPIDIRPLLAAALAEDIGSGDITSLATIPATTRAKFAMNARQEMVACGLVFLPELFAMVEGSLPLPAGEVENPLEDFRVRASDAGVTVTLHVRDGDKVASGTTLATLEGPARALLAGERTALNLVQQLSGVATLTAQYVAAVAGTKAQILDTRKTIPSLRAAQKYAVKCGGGQNHRMGLYDAILIKDNHIAVAGGVAAAVKAAKAYVLTASGAAGKPFSLLREKEEPAKREDEGSCHTLERQSLLHPPSPNPLPEEGEGSDRASLNAYGPIKIQIECDTLAQLAEALAAGADSVLLDNMSNAQLREAVAKVRTHNAKTGQQVKTEASGNVSLETVRGIAETGVDYISVGKLTHSAPAVDIGLDEAQGKMA